MSSRRQSSSRIRTERSPQTASDAVSATSADSAPAQDLQDFVVHRSGDQYYRQMFEKNRAVKLLIDPSNGSIIDANPAAAEYYGYSVGQLKQMRISQINTLPPEEIKKEMHKALHEHRAYFQFKHRLSSGEVRDVEVYSSPLEVGGKNLLFSIIHDINERKQSEAALQQSVSLLRATLESTADGILVVDTEGKIISYNRRFADMWHIPLSVLEHNDDDQALVFVQSQLKDPDAFLARVRELYEQPDAESHDVIEFTDGRVYERYSRPQRIGTDYAGRVWSFRDVTVQRQAEEEITQWNAELERRVAQRTEQIEAVGNRLRMILDNLPIGVFIGEGEPDERTVRFTYINRAGQEIVAAPTVTPGSISETFTVVHPDGTPYKEEDLPVQYTLWTGEAVSARDMLFRYHDGTERFFTSNATVLNQEGNTTEVIAVTQDITERRRLEERVQKQAKTLQAQYERLAALVNSMDIALSLMDTEGRIQVVNETWERRNGLRRGDVVGKRYTDIIASDEREVYRQFMERVLNEGEPVQFRDYLVPDGPYAGHYIDLYFQPIFESDDPTPTGLVTIGVDVTEKALSRQQVESQRELLSAILDNSPVSIAFYDRSLRLLRANSTWERINGLEREKALGQSLATFPLIIQNDLLPFYQRAVQGETVKMENVQHRREGEERVRYLDITCAPVRGVNDNIEGLVSLIIDMTDRQELSIQKDLFMAMASHELKTPITSIKGLAQMGSRAANKLGDERLARNLQTIDRQANRLTRMINDMLDVSRIRSGMFPLTPQTFDLSRSVSQVVESIKVTAPEAKFTLRTLPVPVPVEADRLRIEQVINNLVQNAVKYSGDDPRVEITLKVESRNVVVSVRDHGIGIPESAQMHLFEPFYRVEGAGKPQSGLGLGLFIAHSIITRHGGKMWLDSEQGQGSTFHFSLPINDHQYPD